MEGVAFRGLANPHDPPPLLLMSGWLFPARLIDDSWGLRLSFLVAGSFQLDFEAVLSEAAVGFKTLT